MRKFSFRFVISACLASATSQIALAKESYLCLHCADRVAQKDKGKTPSDVRSDLMGKSKQEVKEYFGRKPDDLPHVRMWVYKVRLYDPDSEKNIKQVDISFTEEGLVRGLNFWSDTYLP